MRGRGIDIEANFSLGLVTEVTELTYPKHSCFDALNVEFDEKGKVKRRLGLDLEVMQDGNSSFSGTLTTNVDTDRVKTEFIWTSVGGDGDKSFLVVQDAATLFFYDISSTPKGVGQSKKTFTVSLESQKPSGSTLFSYDYPCSFANGKGKLLVVNRACDPFYISYEGDTDSISTSSFDIEFRDFEGIESGNSITTRPAADDTTALLNNHAEHYYNILNQGWGNTDTLTQWLAARTDAPSDADIPGLYRASATDSFDPSKVTSNSSGNTQAPKGHFILTLGEEDRSTVSGIPGLVSNTSALAADSVNTTAIFLTDTANIDFPASYSNFTNLSDGNLTQTKANSTTGVSAWISGTISGGQTGLALYRNFGASPQIIKQVKIKGPSDDVIAVMASGGGGTITGCSFTFYGKNGSVPTIASPGTQLGTRSFTSLSNDQEFSITNTIDTTTAYQYILVLVTPSFANWAGGTITTYVAEVTYMVSQATSYARPESVSFFAGRAWYSSVNYGDKGTNIYFSQVIERPSQFGQCYQVNDPTSEEFFDLLATDGGSISIPEMANVVAIFPMRSALLILATNGTWIIRGGSSEGFSATSFRVENISNIGCVSKSIANVKGIPVWMGEDGIYTVEYDPNFNAFQQKSLTDRIIASFIDDISPLAKKYCKLSYDPLEKVFRVLYNNSQDLLSDEYYTYNSILTFRMSKGSWSPSTFSTPGTIKVHGIVNVFDSNHVYPNSTKFLFSCQRNSDTFYYLLFAELNNTDYKDWKTVAADITASSGNESDYESFVITSPHIPAQRQPIEKLGKSSQTNYLCVFTEDDTDGSLLVQARYDWSDNDTSGKWSTPQESYRYIRGNRRVNYSRLKMRGFGRATQYKFYSTTGKPFTLLGWTTIETFNGDV